MGYKLDEIINLPKIKNMLDNLYCATNVPYKVVDSEGRILISTGLKEIFKNIHNGNINNINDLGQIKNLDQIMMNVDIPIIAEGNHIGTLSMVHFFVTKPDVEYFKIQARELEIDEEEYLKAVNEIPVFDIEKVKNFTSFLFEIGDMIAEMAVNQIKLTELSNKLNKQYKKIVKCQKERTDFFANISHELRTPINVIYSAIQVSKCVLNSENLDRQNKESKLSKYFDIIKQNSYRLIKLINNLIDITKIDANYLNLDLVNCDIVEIIKSITLSIQDFIISRELNLYFETNVENKIMACDENKVERIILNLLSNAIKYTDRGGSIYVRVIDKGNLMQISVKDTGIGIPLEKQKSIFDRFSQGEKSFSGIQQSSGIGLSLVKALVEMHEGNISLNSECGEGSEFIIELPVKVIKGNSKVHRKYDLNSSSKVENINIEFSDIYAI